jgi:hypothetical protein
MREAAFLITYELLMNTHDNTAPIETFLLNIYLRRICLLIIASAIFHSTCERGNLVPMAISCPDPDVYILSSLNNPRIQFTPNSISIQNR